MLKDLASEGTDPARNVRVVPSLGEIFSTEAVPQLQAALKDPDPDISKVATFAMGNIGDCESTAPLVDMLQRSPPNQQVIAAKTLGTVGALHDDTAIIPPLLNALATDDVALRKQIVWALRQPPDRQAYEPLVALQQSLRSVRTRDRNTPEGEIWEAANSSIKQLDGFDQNN